MPLRFASHFYCACRTRLRRCFVCSIERCPVTCNPRVAACVPLVPFVLCVAFWAKGTFCFRCCVTRARIAAFAHCVFASLHRAAVVTILPVPRFEQHLPIVRLRYLNVYARLFSLRFSVGCLVAISAHRPLTLCICVTFSSFHPLLCVAFAVLSGYVRTRDATAPAFAFSLRGTPRRWCL